MPICCDVLKARHLFSNCSPSAYIAAHIYHAVRAKTLSLCGNTMKTKHVHFSPQVNIRPTSPAQTKKCLKL